MELWRIIILVCLGFIFLFFSTFLFLEFLKIRKKVSEVKDTVIAKLDIFNRKFFIEDIPQLNKKIIKEIKLKKWNKFSLITNLFSEDIAKKFIEIFDKLEKGAATVNFTFDDISIYKKNQMSRYYFSFNKLEDSTDYLFKFNYITKDKTYYTASAIQSITKTNVIKSQKQIKGFMAFHMTKNQDYSITRFLKLLKIKHKMQDIYYFKYNNLLIIVILKNKIFQVKKIIAKIKKQVEKNYFANEFRYLYNGSAYALSEKIITMKNVNQTLQTLKFLILDSVYTKKQFLFATRDFFAKKFWLYNNIYKEFDQIISEKNFKIMRTDVLTIKNNFKLVNYVFPYIDQMEKTSYDLLMSDQQNSLRLSNAFAEKILFRVRKNIVMFEVDGAWLLSNFDKIKNKNVILVIKFNLLNKRQRNLLMKKLNILKITFALEIQSYDQGVDYILQSEKPPLIIIDRNVWTENKTLTPDGFIKLILLNFSFSQNNIKTIYKNPSLILDEKTNHDIGLKYYFKVK